MREVKSNMDNFSHEIGFIRSFVTKNKQDRFIGFVRSKKHRGEFASELDHPNFISLRFAKEIAPVDQNPDSIATILRRKTKRDRCFVISTNESINQKHMLIEDALENTVGHSYGTILSIIPGRLAYFEDEDGDRFILAKYVS